MPDPSKQRRQCAECGRWFFPRDDGTTIHHANVPPGQQEPIYCLGSGLQPAALSSCVTSVGRLEYASDRRVVSADPAVWTHWPELVRSGELRARYGDGDTYGQTTLYVRLPAQEGSEKI